MRDLTDITDYGIVENDFINRLVGCEGLEPPTFSV